MEGRYWLQLEWRALAAALGAAGRKRAAALGDALAFRAARHRVFPEAAANARLDEIREGLAQYTGTVVATASAAEATSNAIRQLEDAPNQPGFVRTAAYTLGVAYGLLLDAWSPGWTRQIQVTDDLAQLLTAASDVRPTDDVLVSIDGATLRLPAPASASGTLLTGEDWTVELAPGWVAQPGSRAGDFQVVRAHC